jgi:hypothetical protein
MTNPTRGGDVATALISVVATALIRERDLQL